jgi:hypothetical protein
MNNNICYGELPADEIEKYIFGKTLEKIEYNEKFSESTVEKFLIAWDVCVALSGFPGRGGVLKTIREKLAKCLVEKIRKEFNNIYNIPENDKTRGFCEGKKEANGENLLIIYKENWTNQKDDELPSICFAIGFGQYDFYDLYYGIYKLSEPLNVDVNKIMDKLSNMGFKTGDPWIAWKYFESPYGGLWEKEFYCELLQKGFELTVTDNYISELKKMINPEVDKLIALVH